MLVWLTAFVWTCALEVPVYTLALRRHLTPDARLLAFLIGINGVTHAGSFLVLTQWFDVNTFILPLEAGIALTEGLMTMVYLRQRTDPPAPAWLGPVTALGANVFSYLAGFVLKASLLAW